MKQKEALWIPLKVNKRNIHGSALPQFIVVEHLEVLFWRDAQTRNISLRVRFDLVIWFVWPFYLLCRTSPPLLQHIWVNAFPSQGLCICNNVSRGESRTAGDQERQIAVSRFFFFLQQKKPCHLIVPSFLILSPSTDIPSRFDLLWALHFRGVQGSPFSIRPPIRSILLCKVVPASSLKAIRWIMRWI